MKIYLTILVLLIHFTSISQKTPKNYCQNGDSCHLYIASIFPDYKIIGFEADSIRDIKGVFYENKQQEALTFTYSVFSDGSQKLKTVIAKLEVIYKILTSYYGREIAFEKLKVYGDFWKFEFSGSRKGLEVDEQGKPGYYRLSLHY